MRERQITVDDLTLLDDAVLLRLEKPERMTASKLLWIPETAKRAAHELYVGTVLAVGPGPFRPRDGGRNPMEVAPGDRVQFYWAAGEMDVTALFEGDAELRVISEKSIQCVIN